MLTQEERLSALERSMISVNGAISDINHNETMLLGMVTKQEEIIREVNARLAAVNERLAAVNERLTAVNERLAAVNEHLVTFEQSVNSRFDEHTTLLTQILARLPEKPQQ